jgi:sirohydrochlorin cobaltochelatase
MTALLLYSHGSLVCGAGEALEKHVTHLKEQQVAEWVGMGYLNYSAPRFADAAEEAIAAGATEIVIVPYLLISGYFVTNALPEVLAPVQAKYPDARFTIAEALNEDVRLAEALLESAKTARPPEQWGETITRLSHHCPRRTDCPLYEACVRPAVFPSSFFTSPEAASPFAPSGFAKGELQDAKLIPPHGTRTQPFAPQLPLREAGGGEGAKRHSGEAKKEEGDTGRGTLENTALLVLVHGSPRPVANTTMFRVVDQVRTWGVYPIVEVGFMECNTPTILDAIDTCVAQGALQIVAVPYFVHAGTHVCQDLPALLEEGRVRHPQVAFRLGDYIGLSPHLSALLAVRYQAAGKSERESVAESP